MAARGTQTAVVLEDGGLLTCGGSNESERFSIGHGDTANQREPVRVGGVDGVVAVVRWLPHGCSDFGWPGFHVRTAEVELAWA